MNLLNPKVFNYALFNFELKESSLVESIVQIVLEYQITEIHSHYSFVYGFACVNAKKILKNVYNLDVKLILVCHGTDVIGYDPYNIGKEVFLHYNRYTIKEANYVVCASKALKQLIEKIYGINKEIIIIPNFVDSSKFRVITDKMRRRPSVVHISNFREVKRPRFVIEIFKKINDKVPNAKLIMIGTGPLLNDVMTYVNELELSNNVESVGKLESEDQIIKILNSVSLC